MRNASAQLRARTYTAVRFSIWRVRYEFSFDMQKDSLGRQVLDHLSFLREASDSLALPDVRASKKAPRTRGALRIADFYFE